MFNEKIKELQKEFNEALKEKEKEIKELREALSLPLPKNCKKGDYCKACAFSTKKTINNYFGSYEIFICCKDSCKEFVKGND